MVGNGPQSFQDMERVNILQDQLTTGWHVDLLGGESIPLAGVDNWAGSELVASVTFLEGGLLAEVTVSLIPDLTLLILLLH